MGNLSIYADRVTKTLHAWETLLPARSETAAAPSFQEALLKKYEDSGKEAGSFALPRKDMSREEYRQYVKDQISRIPMHPSQSGWHWQISITDEGLAAMQDDPAYEAFVLKTIRSNFSFCDRFGSSNYTVLTFGASAEECRSESVSGGSPFMEKEESFWERRARRREKLRRQQDELADKKALAKNLAKNGPCAKKPEDRAERGAAALLLTAATAADLFDTMEDA